MNLGRVVGVVVSTQKVDSLKGVKFYVVEPQNEKGEKIGDSLVSVDTVSSRVGDLVIWVSSREAALALEETFNPVDAAVIGIVDSVGHPEPSISHPERRIVGSVGHPERSRLRRSEGSQ